MAQDEYLNTDTMRLRISDLTHGAHPGVHRPARQEASPVADTHPKEFTELFESVYDAVVLTALDGKILKVNARALNFFQYSLGQAYQLNILNLLTGADEQLLNTICQTLRNERRVFIEGYCVRKDQTLFPGEITVSIIHLAEAEQLCFFIRNIAVRKKTEEALQKAQRELLDSAHRAGMAEIATGVLHDVGNILNSVNVSCELILAGIKNSTLPTLCKANELLLTQGDRIGEFFTTDPRGRKMPQLYHKLGQVLSTERDEIGQEATNLQTKIAMIRDVIAMQQQYAKSGLFKEEIRLNEIVEDALAILKASISRHSLRVVKQYGEEPVVMANKSKLIHVLLNLIQNAKDALATVPEGQRVLTIETGATEECLFIRLTDNGEGISPENLDRIFNHGFTTKPSGHGFGLHTCANFMTEMNGKIWAESDGPGTGATFWVTFPREADKAKE